MASWAWISGDGPVGALLALCALFPMFFVVAWFGRAAWLWAAEIAEDAWDLLFGED